MSHFLVDPEFAFHKKAANAGNSAIGLWVRAGAWCIQNESKGFVPEDVVRRIGTAAQADRLVRSGLWVTAQGGYEYHDWVQFYGDGPENFSGDLEIFSAPPSPDLAESQVNGASRAPTRGVSTLVPSVVSTKDKRDAATTDVVAGATTANRNLVKRAQAIADAYYDLEPFCNYAAVLGVAKKALRLAQFSDEEIHAAIVRLAVDSRTVSMNSLRVELKGDAPRRSSSVKDARISSLDRLKA